MSPIRKKVYRIVAAYLLLNMTAELLFPVAAHALTNGPGQPEFQSFEPAGSTEMVNLFTGDFSYNIPLMTVPGPNGGYPINLAYHAGIGMEQEASWVGLGWNINAGAINRSMRGLPDDFKGDQVIKKLHFKPSNSLVLNFGQSPVDPNNKQEIFGFNSLIGTGVQVYYNNYRGVGFQFAANFAIGSASSLAEYNGPPLRLNLTSSSDGIGVNANYSTSYTIHGFRKSSLHGLGASMSWGSREGLAALQLYSYKGARVSAQHMGAGVAFVNNGFIPQSTPEIDGFISNVGLEFGQNLSATPLIEWEANKATTLIASYNRSWVKNTTENYDAYGYMQNENIKSLSAQNILQDINRDKGVPSNRQTKSLAVPVAAYDGFSVTGQGMGGSFRAYRSDIGIYTDNNVESNIYGGTANVEWGAPTVGTPWVKFGGDASFMHTKTESGIWKYPWGMIVSDPGGYTSIDPYQFTALDADGAYSTDHAYQPFYFKMAGELTSSPESQLDFMLGSSPVRFQLNEVFGDGSGISPRPTIQTDILYSNSSSVDLSSSNGHRASREKTVTRNIYRTDGEMSAFTTNVPENLYDRNDFYALDNTVTGDQYVYGNQQPHHLAEFTETGADGSRYIYGLPVYANETKEVMFSKNGFPKYPENYSFSYGENEASLGNNEAGTDELYSSTETPGYAESYLLTQVVSPDYVDVTGDGPTEDDLGYYTKFNYTLIEDAFKWRAPYYGAILNSGFLSNTNDDKMSYMYGTKEVYLLHSIETKTHVACFFLDETARKDGHGAIAEYVLDSTIYHSQVANADKMWSLDHVSLYSKADPDYGTTDATPIKSVFFNYDYSLCPGTDNNENSSTNTGKLTLNEIYFTYRNNEKGKLSPYQFEYVDASYEDDLENPGYDPLGNDRWGTYKKQESGNYRNNENPYTDQKNRTDANQSAAAWCLKEITLPSGSIVNITYEADDYAYVQNKQAMQMCKVVGFGEDDVSNTNTLSDMTEKLNKKNTRVYFELNTPIDDAATDKEEQVAAYVEGIDELYFKMFLKLRKPYSLPAGDDVYDYVDGFCKIKQGTGYSGVVDGGTGIDHLYAYFTIETVERDDYPSVPGANVHPMEKAAWQHMYLERPDLFVNPDIASGAVSNLVSAASAMITDLPRAVAPYITANARGWGNKMDADASHECDIRPSYVRLNSPNGKKVGGGHRVQQISITDSWDAISTHAGIDGEYGQTYSYELVDGKSSGVASYEPLMGGEENAMCLPLRYNSDNLVKKDEAFYVMEPLGESYYPTPVVGYSRVIVSSIDKEDSESDPVTISRTGKTEYEFYTAKDYPVIADRTDLQKTWFPIPVVIPFVGSISYSMRGYSQGYSIVLNDMHGKLKAVATYPSYADLNGSATMPTRRVFYKYNGGYDANKTNSLNSVVDVLTTDGVYGEAALGETYDFFFDLRQFSNKTEEYGGQANISINLTTFASVPTLMPSINISKSMCRTSVAMKVIYRTGILTEVETMDDGAKSTARNLMFDAETGAPLLTVVENEFERPVYTYNFAAHWAYEGMQGAYQNQGVRFGAETTDVSGLLVVTGAEDYFYPGDEVMYIPDAGGAGTMLWVKTVDDINDEVELIEADGTSAASYASGTFIIHRSGRRNLQSVSNGVIVSLSNPVTDRTYPLFEAFNACTTSITSNPQTLTDFYVDCGTGEARDIRFSISDDVITIVDLDGGCEAFITFPDEVLADLADAFTWDLNYTNGVLTASKTINSVLVTHTLTWDNNGCFQACMEDVLHASAVRFAENWSTSVTGHEQEINFSDVGVTPTANDYKFGLRGVWRTHSNYLYQVKRKQTIVSASKTDISKDGTYDHFVIYNWEIAAQDNTLWSFVSAVTRYSPYGYALETRDALGIYSSVMYGYENTKQTAAAANCQYFEMAFDGFEDYAAGYTGHGHMLFVDQNATYPTGIDALYAHSGKYSYAVQNGGDAQFTISTGATYSSTQQYFQCQPGQEYFFSVWARSDDGGTPAVIVNTGSPVTYTPDLSKSAIDGWRKIDVRFTAPASGSFTIKLSCQTTGQANFDDIRIQPFKSAMTSYVYDPQTHWLLAELDNRNYATFYNYDEEGALVQVKQETEKGIFTVQTSRGNIIRQ